MMAFLSSSIFIAFVGCDGEISAIQIISVFFAEARSGIGSGSLRNMFLDMKRCPCDFGCNVSIHGILMMNCSGQSESWLEPFKLSQNDLPLGVVLIALGIFKLIAYTTC